MRYEIRNHFTHSNDPLPFGTAAPGAKEICYCEQVCLLVKTYIPRDCPLPDLQRFFAEDDVAYYSTQGDGKKNTIHHCLPLFATPSHRTLFTTVYRCQPPSSTTVKYHRQVPLFTTVYHHPWFTTDKLINSAWEYRTAVSTNSHTVL
jgi:hypothetical protein